MELITQYLKIINIYPFKIIGEEEFKILNLEKKIQNETNSFFLNQNLNQTEIGSVQTSNFPRTLIYDSGNNSYFQLGSTQTIQAPTVSLHNPDIHFESFDSNILHSINYSQIIVNLNDRVRIVNTNTISFILGEYHVFEDGEEYSESKLFYSHVIPILLDWINYCYEENQNQFISDSNIRILPHFTRQIAETRYRKKI
jgi:hypothetical protein